MSLIPSPRILFTGTVGESLPPPYGGIPKRALLLAAAWRKQGVVTGFTFTYKHDKPDDLGAGGEYFFEYQSKPGKIAKLFFILKYVCKNPSLYFKLLDIYRRTYKGLDRQGILYPAYGVFLDEVYTKFRPNVIVAEAALIQGFIAGHVAKMRGIPFVIETYAEVHDKTMTKSLRLNDAERDVYWKDFLGLAEHIIAPSDYCACGPLAYAPSSKVTMVFATTLDVNRFDKFVSAEEKARLRAKFNIPNDLFLVMAVGAFTNRKGHDHIVEAAALIKDSYTKIGVVLCGAGDPQWLKDLAAAKGITNRVFFFQKVSEADLTDLYHTVDVYCDASNTPRACLGIALTEGLASRLPAIAYDVAGLPESVHDGENGYLVPLNDVPALGKSFGDMFDRSPEERRVLGERGVALARKQFDLTIIAEQVLEVLKKVAK